jgi:hypothetical protein
MAVAAVTDDKLLAAVVSLFHSTSGRYFPVVEPPRISRPDASSEAVEVANALSLFGPTKVVLLRLGDAERAAIESRLGRVLTPTVIADMDELLAYLQVDRRSPSQMRRTLNPYLVDLLPENQVPHELQPYLDVARGSRRHASQRGIVVTEPLDSIGSVVAANYAWAYGYDFRTLVAVDDLTRERIDEMLMAVDAAILAGHPKVAPYDELLAQLRVALPDSEAWPEGVPLCFYTRAAPYGILFKHNPTCHVFDLKAGLNTAYSVGWAEFERTRAKRPGHIAVFVDPLWPDIRSETNDIVRSLVTQAYGVTTFTGDAATCDRFRLIANHFPYDVLYVSSHGQAPRYRWCRHLFTSRVDGREHVIETHEFEYFAARGDKVAVTQKTYPLSVDGVSWKDKETLARTGAGAVLAEFFETRDGPRTPSEFRWVSNTRVEGIALRDGVFFGPLYRLAGMGHPVVVFNCCSMWSSMAIQVMHARARAYIATLWSVRDDAAVAFGAELGSTLSNYSVVEGAFHAAQTIRHDLSSGAYVCLTWPHVRLPKPYSCTTVTVRMMLLDRLARHFWGMAATLRDTTVPEDVYEVLAFLADQIHRVEEADRPLRRLGHPTVAAMDGALERLRPRIVPVASDREKGLISGNLE